MALEVDIEKRLGSFHLRAAFSCGREFMGILGASGCGKSMTLKCIAGIEKPDRGRIVLDSRVLFDSEKRINLPPQQRRVGYLFQDYELLRLREVASLQHEALSGGQAQRAALGRILVNEPDLLMLDEPFSALDSFLRLKLQTELKALLAGYDRGILMVTHDRDEAFRMCDRLGVMEQGQMQTVKGTKELFADPETRAAAVLTGCKNIAEAQKTGEHEVIVPEWGIRLTTGKPVRDGLKAVGIRAHDFHPDTEENCFPVRILRETEEPFEWISEFRYEHQADGSPPVWRRYSREFRTNEPPKQLGVAPADVLLLYE